MKVIEFGLNMLIDNLNILICEDSLFMCQECEILVWVVVVIGVMKVCVSMKKGEVLIVVRWEKREKKDCQFDLCFL